MGVSRVLGCFKEDRSASRKINSVWEFLGYFQEVQKVFKGVYTVSLGSFIVISQVSQGHFKKVCRVFHVI